MLFRVLCSAISISRYIILYIKRFTKNNFFVEKNPTIVNFPLSHIEFGDLLSEDVKDKHDAGTTYDLIGNVVHDGSPCDQSMRLSIKSYRAHPCRKISTKVHKSSSSGSQSSAVKQMNFPCALILKFLRSSLRPVVRLRPQFWSKTKSTR